MIDAINRAIDALENDTYSQQERGEIAAELRHGVNDAAVIVSLTSREARAARNIFGFTRACFARVIDEIVGSDVCAADSAALKLEVAMMAEGIEL